MPIAMGKIAKKWVDFSPRECYSKENIYLDDGDASVDTPLFFREPSAQAVTDSSKADRMYHSRVQCRGDPNTAAVTALSS